MHIFIAIAIHRPIPGKYTIHSYHDTLISGPNRALAVCSETDEDINMEGIIKTRFDVLQSLDTDRLSEKSYFNLKRHVLNLTMCDKYFCQQFY